jgi:prophage regulatory protein
MQTKAQRLLPRPEVCTLMGRSSASLHGDMKRGTFVQPIRTGPNSARWPETEVAAIQQARIAGKSEDQIRELVTKLQAARTAEPVSA